MDESLDSVVGDLKRDHRAIVALLAQLISQSDPHLRESILTDFRSRWTAYATNELTRFHSWAQITQAPIQPAHDHAAISGIIGDLTVRTTLGQAWMGLASQLRHAVETHLRADEEALNRAIGAARHRSLPIPRL